MVEICRRYGRPPYARHDRSHATASQPSASAPCAPAVRTRRIRIILCIVREIGACSLVLLKSFPIPATVDIRLSFALSFPRFWRGKMVLPLTKRQREILDYLNEFIQQHGYAPSLEEIGRRFSLSSLATVHKHLTNLQEKGFIKRAWNRSRSVEMVPTRTGGRAVELPMLGYVAYTHLTLPTIY